MSYTDPIAYVVDAALVCCDCASVEERREGAVFSSSETDCPTHCDRCGELIPEALTAEGEAYVAQALLDHYTDGRGDASVLATWAQEWDVASLISEMVLERVQNVDMADPESGTVLVRVAREAIAQCSHEGDCEADVRRWIRRATWTADDSRLREMLRGFGAWDDLATVDRDTLKTRALWILCVNEAEALKSSR